MLEQETISREVFYFIGSGVAAFLMALSRTTRFADKEHRRWAIKFNEALMCAMISSGIAVVIKTYFNAPFSWAIPIGVIVGFIGTNFIHVLIKSLIEFQVGRYTGGKVSLRDIEAVLRSIEADKGKDQKNNPQSEKGSNQHKDS